MRLILFLAAALTLFYLYYANYMKPSEIEVFQGEVKEKLNPIDYAKKAMAEKIKGSDETERKVKEALK